MLDNCSQGCFIHDSMIKKLGIVGINTTLNLKTLHWEKSESTIAVEGIKVAGIHGDGCWVILPKSYSQMDIPVDREEIAAPVKVQEWRYLESISDELVKDDNVQVGLLIGANCTKALEPMKIIPSQYGGTYAYKTKLGWCVVGPITCTEEMGYTACN